MRVAKAPIKATPSAVIAVADRPEEASSSFTVHSPRPEAPRHDGCTRIRRIHRKHRKAQGRGHAAYKRCRALRALAGKSGCWGAKSLTSMIQGRAEAGY
jgi:hypothetical protein